MGGGASSNKYRPRAEQSDESAGTEHAEARTDVTQVKPKDPQGSYRNAIAPPRDHCRIAKEVLSTSTESKARVIQPPGMPPLARPGSQPSPKNGESAVAKMVAKYWKEEEERLVRVGKSSSLVSIHEADASMVPARAA
eukprot:gnl/MRDRNA2_/MRDRNA2_63152_c0_seq1.p1 gnl/MRDRNA2_/MRDRNA2_63152_c0~~gnl/MRDRNA2_/MRDRNA2_63152_c0_seq1.p1  ORF type:complete len:138 (+),score=22.08 gnl/MRDRNA2_/MRDRNA2_63152_c0_seq1:139-552(+)